MAGGKKKRAPVQLPAAPLTEVVFELRWDLRPAPPPLGQFDPMLLPTIHRFTAAMEKSGFPHRIDLIHPIQTAPYGVVCRYYRDSESPYPLMQIGAGIFATNESSKYEWISYRAQVLDGVRALLSSYPTDLGAQLKPTHIELRYTDVFTKDITQDNSYFDFAKNSTFVTFSLPDFLKDRQLFWGDPVGRFFYEHALRERKDSFFAFDLASGKNGQSKEDIVQLVSRVASTGRGVPSVKTPGTFVKEVQKWLDLAHGILSPFFRNFVKPEVMEKFERRGS